LTEQDFSGFNATLTYLSYFLEKILVDERKRELATRLLYLLTSHLLIIMDYLLKDVAFLQLMEKEKRLSDGLKFGNLGQEGVEQIISMAVKLSGNRSAQSFMKSLDSGRTDILKEFFGKNENAKNIFTWARELEHLGFLRVFKNPEHIDVALKGIVSVLLDFWQIDRRRFFGLFSDPGA